MPPLQMPLSQTFPHEPQFCESDCISAQMPGRAGPADQAGRTAERADAGRRRTEARTVERDLAGRAAERRVLVEAGGWTTDHLGARLDADITAEDRDRALLASRTALLLLTGVAARAPFRAAAGFSAAPRRLPVATLRPALLLLGPAALAQAFTLVNAFPLRRAAVVPRRTMPCLRGSA